MFGLNKEKKITVGQIRIEIKKRFDIKDPYEIRFYNSNGNQRRADGTSVEMPDFPVNPTLGIRTVAELCEKIEKRFPSEVGNLVAQVWDAHTGEKVDGRTHYATIRN